MSGTRAEKARATRGRMLDAARTLFVERGWARTSVEDVARAAGVATQTVYYTFGTKHALFAEVLDVTVAGDAEPVATLDRDWARHALGSPDPRDHLRRQVAGTRTVMERVVPLLRTLREAAPAHEEMAALWAENQHQRREVTARFTASLAGKATLRVPEDRARDVTYVTLGPEVYDQLVESCGWSGAQWEDWAADALVRQLLA
ncbi:TetR/AcrR family transcriptional regulator [Oerskovia flava]|uniref:TetR/AcrR family transcriptional regulator n=1 Tax=Oerskovia flava TaxID=2986422 RepID=UPI002240AB1A|nr:TetR/AcrR family transcriptional regulator [Oerskovia sp. JB1-3-2]